MPKHVAGKHNYYFLSSSRGKHGPYTGKHSINKWSYFEIKDTKCKPKGYTDSTVQSWHIVKTHKGMITKSPSLKINVPLRVKVKGSEPPFCTSSSLAPPHSTSPPQRKAKLQTSTMLCSINPSTPLAIIHTTLSSENCVKARKSPAKHLVQQVWGRAGEFATPEWYCQQTMLVSSYYHPKTSSCPPSSATKSK